MSSHPSTKPIYQPAGANPIRRTGSRYTVRLWVVRNSRFFEWVYKVFADTLLRLHWLWSMIGYERVERPVVFIEKQVKQFLFDCRMCGQCALSHTGMSCPMNCPKELRNGPCGGVRANGNCEIEKDMPCVWVQAWRGSQMMNASDNIMSVQKPIQNNWRGTSSWLRATVEQAAKNSVEKSAEKSGEKFGENARQNGGNK